MAEQQLKWTGERLVTSIEDETATEHLHRYKIAMDLCKGKSVIDIACGEGYGSSFLADVASSVIGVDIDPEAVSFAAAKYKKKNLEYRVGNCAAIPAENESVDVLVSFETIEHHDQHDEMMREVKRVLKPGGLLIISTPDRVQYSDMRNFKNSFHVKELTEEEFEILLKKYFKNLEWAYQRIMYGSFILKGKGGTGEFNLYQGDYSKLSGFQMAPFYHFVLASDNAIPEITPSFFNGDQILRDRMSGIVNSFPYRLGNFLLRPVRGVARVLGLKK
jgi:ubiquinone/menaquinone biosynthesis C-methylase UbiE